MDKRWVNIFKVLGNINRLKIIKMLASGKIMNVTEISEELDISFKSTSQHLVILQKMDLLDSIGKDGHVYYSLDKNIPLDFKRAIKLFC
ncbi:MAG: metalloregulator ArsR/SmtB family transcription factor [bacterium]